MTTEPKQWKCDRHNTYGSAGTREYSCCDMTELQKFRELVDNDECWEVCCEHIESFLLSSNERVRAETLREVREKMKTIIEKIELCKWCVFESDGYKHSCIEPCEGMVENCMKCRRDQCSNEQCPLGKGKDDHAEPHNDSLDIAKGFIVGFVSTLDEMLKENK